MGISAYDAQIANQHFFPMNQPPLQSFFPQTKPWVAPQHALFRCFFNTTRIDENEDRKIKKGGGG